MPNPYRSDLTDAQWDAIQALRQPAKPRFRAHMCEVVNTLFYQAKTRCPRSYLPHHLLPRSTVWDGFSAWRADGTGNKTVEALPREVCVAAGREATPRPACIESASVMSTEVSRESAHDRGKNGKARKGHIVVVTFGLLLAVAVTTALGGGTTAPKLLGNLSRSRLPPLQNNLWADSKDHTEPLNEWLKERKAPDPSDVSSRLGCGGPPGLAVPIPPAHQGLPAHHHIQRGRGHLMRRRVQAETEHPQPPFTCPNKIAKAAMAATWFPDSLPGDS